jgi:hypothetical protein
MKDEQLSHSFLGCIGKNKLQYRMLYTSNGKFSILEQSKNGYRVIKSNLDFNNAISAMDIINH